MKKNNILTLEELLQERNIYSNILNQETIEYINSLINLELSAINRVNSDIIRDVALVKLKFFRDVIAFNIYQNSKKIMDGNNNYYTIVDNNSLFICTENKKLQSVLYNFDYNYNDEDKFTINLYGDDVATIEERIELLEQAIIDKNEEINLGAEESNQYSSYIKSREYLRLACQLNDLKSKSLSDLKKEYEDDYLLARERRKVLDTVLDLNNLDITSDFIPAGNELIAQYPHTKIVVKNFKNS